jgi:hypothetical protein
MTGKRIAQCCALAAALALLAHVPAQAKLSDPWLPIDPADLAMKSEPLAPGAQAIYLYRENDDDDTQGYDDYYIRIKVLTDEGKSEGNVEIPYYSKVFTVSSIRARTIQPDGSIIDWNGKVLDQTVVKAHGVKVLEKTFTLPDVQAGSIIEYKYRVGWDKDSLYRTTWVITTNMFTRRLHDVLKPYAEEFVLMWQWQNLPGNLPPSQSKDGLIHYDAQNVPGIAKEEFMPPEDAIEGKIDLFYTTSVTNDVNKYWKQADKDWNGDMDGFVKHSSAIRDEAGKVAPASDPPETRLRKLYARAQQIRNLSAEMEKTTQEIKTEKLKDDKTAEDVLKNGYGYGPDINGFFIALARAAGFDASSVRVSDRAIYFFNPRILDRRQFENAEVVLVKLNGQDIYLDPASPHTAFGQLEWDETGVAGLKLDGQGGTFVTTTPPTSSDAITERTATLKLGDDGWLEGKLIVSFAGEEARIRRSNADTQDDADRTKSLSDEVTAWLPAGATLKLTNQPDWAGSESPLIAEFDVRTRPVGSLAGHIALLSENLFSDADLPRFDHPQRTYAIYFDYPWEFHDDVTLTLPLMFQAGDPPAPINLPSPFGTYQLSCTKQPGALHFQRLVTLHGFYYDMQYYGDLRKYFDEVRNADQQKITLRATGTQNAQTH